MTLSDGHEGRKSFAAASNTFYTTLAVNTNTRLYSTMI